MRGDTAFMSLINHRYLAIQPIRSGPVTASVAVAALPDGALEKCHPQAEAARPPAVHLYAMRAP
jgi:hypothetical protein